VEDHGGEGAGRCGQRQQPGAAVEVGATALLAHGAAGECGQRRSGEGQGDEDPDEHVVNIPIGNGQFKYLCLI
jgi:hypothetical protein